MEQAIIANLDYGIRTYERANKMIVATKNMFQQKHPGADPKLQPEVQLMEAVKSKMIFGIKKDIEMFDVWNQWLTKVPGIGPAIGGPLIYMYYFKNVPVCPVCESAIEKRETEKNGRKINQFYCQKCERFMKGDGNLTFKIVERDFPTVSAFWSFMGMATVDGAKPKMKKGTPVTWSPKGRTLAWQFGQQINRQKPGKRFPDGTPYWHFFNSRWQKRKKTHQETSDGHRLNMALHETAKLFLSHFWHVAREIDGKPTKTIYAEGILGHENIIAPYYWK